ncbi:MAG: hypothetical protein AB7E16_01755 [Candidatus Izemoplasmatales bacterium]
MKKVFLLFLMIFAVTGFVACNNSGSEVEVNYDEQIAFPTNLSINGKILSWDAVTDAKGYEIYVDGEKVDTVKTNSYDFSGLEGSRIIFTVVTEAPRGMVNSEHSVTIAYVEDVAGEVAAMNLVIQESGMPIGEDFAEALVYKGMLASEFEDMVDAMETFVNATETIDSADEAYDVIDAMMESVENPEAIIYALIKTMLPEVIDQQISDLEDQNDYYQDMKDSGYFYYQDYIDENNQEIAMLEEMQSMMADSEDEIVKTVLFVIEYIMSIEEMISEDLITGITNLSELDRIDDLNVTEVVLVKEEIVNILNETMPKQSEIVLALNTVYSMTSIVEEMEDVQFGELVYPEKAAAQMLMTFEAFIKYLDNFDQAFFTELKSIGTSDVSDERMQAELIILQMDYLDNYLEENETLLDEIENIYTDEEKELMFNDSIAMAEDALEAEGSPITDLSFLTFEKVMALQVIFDDAFNELLDAFVESEGAIALLAVEYNEYQDEFWDTYYMDQDWDEYDLNSEIYQTKLIDQVFYLLNSVISERTQAEFEEVRGMLIEMLKVVIPTAVGDMASTDTQELITAIETFFNNTTEEQYEIIQSVAAFMDEEDILLEYANALETKYSSNITLYASEDSEYFRMAYIIGAYDDYMTSANRNNIDGIIDEVVVLLGEDIFADLEVDTYPTIISDFLDYVDTISGEVAGFDFEDLTSAQKTRLDEIQEEIQDIMWQIN